MAYRCEVYCNTGFNAVDIPDCYDTLKSCFTPWIEYDDIDLIQTEYLGILRLPGDTDGGIPHEVARQVDYIVIEDPDVVPEGMKRCCYTVESFVYTSYDVVEFRLLLDAYNTFGGFKLETSGNEIFSGWANRMSVSLEEDASTFFTLDEPFQPSERSTTEIINLCDYGDDRTVLVETSNIPPQVVENVGATNLPKGIKTPSNASITYDGTSVGCSATLVDQGSGKNSFNYVRAINPRCRKMEPTNIGVQRPDGKVKVFNNATRFWDGTLLNYETQMIRDFGKDGTITAESKTGTLFTDFYNNRLDDSILGVWEVPTKLISLGTNKQYRADVPTGYGGIDSFTNNVISGSQTVAAPTATSGAPYNNKAKYSQSITIMVYSPVSGQSLSKAITDICGTISPDSNSITLPYKITGDVRCGGSPIFLWQYVNNQDQTSALSESIHGGEWRALNIFQEGARQVDKDIFAIQQESLKRQMYGQIASGAVGLGTAIAAGFGSKATESLQIGAGGIASMVPQTATTWGFNTGVSVGAAGAIGSIYGAYRTARAMTEQQEIFNKQAIAAHSSIQISNTDYARDCGLNTFFMVVSKYSLQDMFSYDTFLTQYGYNVGNKRFENKDLFTRPAFNYIRINDLQVKSLSTNQNLFLKVKEQMKMGVRLWHKAPDVQDMFPGGNR